MCARFYCGPNIGLFKRNIKTFRKLHAKTDIQIDRANKFMLSCHLSFQKDSTSNVGAVKGHKLSIFRSSLLVFEDLIIESEAHSLMLLKRTRMI